MRHHIKCSLLWMCLSFRSESRPGSAEVLFSEEMDTFPNDPFPFPFPSPHLYLSVMTFGWQPPLSPSCKGDCPECSLLSREDHSCGCYSDPPMTHLAVDISRWKYIIPGWGSNLVWKARGRWQGGLWAQGVHSQTTVRTFLPKNCSPNPITLPEK